MATRPHAAAPFRQLRWRLMTSAAIICAAAACSPLGKKAPLPYLAQQQPKEILTPKNPLHLATAYWAREYQKNPGNPHAAVSYAKNLKAVGAADRAFGILKQAHQQHPTHVEIASEFGRLALEQGHTQLAMRALQHAQQPKDKTDWRVLSAIGTAHAKLGEHSEAQTFYLAALQKNPNAASVVNNLALSYALSGKAPKAEQLLRRAISNGHDTPRLRQNLALVLGVQRKFGEAEKLAVVDLNNTKAKSNIAYLRNMVSDAKVAVAEPADDDKAAPEKPPAPKVAEAKPAKPPAPKPKTAALDTAPRAQPLTSQTTPLPWAKAEVKPAARQPAPKPKAAEPVKQPAPAAKQPMPAAPPPASTPPVKTAAVATRDDPAATLAPWRATVAREQPKPKRTRSLVYPDLE